MSTESGKPVTLYFLELSFMSTPLLPPHQKFLKIIFSILP